MREICDRHGVLLIADEVITAFGRTGAWTGSRLWGVKPDLMSTAKAITNGYFPFGAVMISEKVADVFESDETSFGAIGHGYTYSAHPVGCRGRPRLPAGDGEGRFCAATPQRAATSCLPAAWGSRTSTRPSATCAARG